MALAGWGEVSLWERCASERAVLVPTPLHTQLAAWQEQAPHVETSLLASPVLSVLSSGYDQPRKDGRNS